MAIAILTTGSRGDTQPYIALGRALEAKGHAVKIAAFEGFRDLVESYGLSFVPVRGDIAGVATSDLARAARHADNPLKFFTSMRNKELTAMLVRMHQDLHAACEGAEAVVYHPGAAVGYFAAEQRGVPSILASPFPVAATPDYPALLFYAGPRLGGMYNRLTHGIFVRGLWMMLKGSLATYWKGRFGGLPAGFGQPFSKHHTASHPTIVSCSPEVLPASGVGSPHVHHDGYWFLEVPANYTPDPALVRFLADGEAPVYVGFGSIGDAESAEETTAIVVEALTKLRTRGILATGWHGLAAEVPAPESLHVVSGAPHDWLFPKMSVVVHHGGAGTTAAALRAGVPSVVVPFGNDQFAWGARVHELGVGSSPVPRKRLTSTRLAEAIDFCRDEAVRARASALALRIRRERGAELAADAVIQAIRSYVADHDPPLTTV